MKVSENGLRGRRHWLMLGYWTGMYVATHIPGLGSSLGSGLFDDADKLVHAGLYAGWIIGWCWVLSARGAWPSARTINLLVLGGTAYAIFDELTQGIVGRKPSVADFLADVIGMAIGVGFVQWMRRRQRGRRATG